MYPSRGWNELNSSNWFRSSNALIELKIGRKCAGDARIEILKPHWKWCQIQWNFISQIKIESSCWHSFCRNTRVGWKSECLFVTSVKLFQISYFAIDVFWRTWLPSEVLSVAQRMKWTSHPVSKMEHDTAASRVTNMYLWVINNIGSYQTVASLLTLFIASD